MAPRLARLPSKSKIIGSEFDKNGDGRVLRSEVKAVKAEQANAAAEERRQFKLRHGVSRSAIIDQGLDANGDGRVTRSESRAAREAAAKAKAKLQRKPTPKKLVVRSVMKSAVAKKTASKAAPPRKVMKAMKAKAKPRKPVIAVPPVPAAAARPRLKRSDTGTHWNR